MREDRERDEDEREERRPRRRTPPEPVDEDDELEEEEDDRQERRRRRPPYPGAVKAAGIIWIVFGGIILLNMLVALLVIPQMAPAGEAKEAAVVGGVCGGIFVGLFGAAFIFVGNQSVQGTAADTMGNGIGSIIFGLLLLGGAIVSLRDTHTVSAIIGFVEAAGLLGAGVLALLAREQYRDWRRARKGAGARARRRH